MFSNGLQNHRRRRLESHSVVLRILNLLGSRQQVRLELRNPYRMQFGDRVDWKSIGNLRLHRSHHAHAVHT